jgi:N-acetylmuramoyl-L-alanine amidase
LTKLFSSPRWSIALLLLPIFAHASTHKSDAWAHNQYSIAEEKSQALQNLAPDEQSRHKFQEVIDSYRRVYYGCPTSSKADASVFAVAETLAEMGRRFHDANLSRSAIAQYQFLRLEYPGSKYRFEALLSVGRVYADDLQDSTKAKFTFEQFLKDYPRNHFADDARAYLVKLVSPTSNPNDAKEPDGEFAKATPQLHSPKESSPLSSATLVAHDDSDAVHITGIHHFSKNGCTEVAVDLDRPVSYTSQRMENPDRVVFDVDAKLSRKLNGKIWDVDDQLLNKIRVAQFNGRTRIVLEIGEHSDFSAAIESAPSRLVINLKDSSAHSMSPAKRIVEADDEEDAIVPNKLRVGTSLPRPGQHSAENSGKKSGVVLAASKAQVLDESRTEPRRSRPLDVREAQPTARGDRSLIRALGLKIGKIVIDPGHGGHDTGTIGPRSLEEKDLVLDVSRRLGRLLESPLGAQVVFTRKDDTFIPLERRTAIANQEQADLFVSVHANSSHDPSARGVETYYLNFSSSPDALEVAARENAVSETSIHELQDLVKQIALKEKIEESREFASDVQQELHTGLAAKNPGLRNRGVKKAPFIVLIGANMPSILAEISFVSNPGDERRLQTAAYRQKIAESLYRGISKYVGGLSGIKVARIEKTSAQ